MENNSHFDLKELKKEMPHKYRVQSFSKYKAECTCVAYVDSRQVQDLLDNVVSPENWQCKYEEIKGNVYCSIGIFVNGQWVWKSDCGTESNVDKEKGEASDSFKRAAVKWGIGRFLYDLGMYTLPASEKKDGKNYPYAVDENGKKIHDITAYINNKKDQAGKITEHERKQLTKELKESKTIENWSNALAKWLKIYPYLENDENFGKFTLSLKPKSDNELLEETAKQAKKVNE